MIRVILFTKNELVSGFEIKGHATADFDDTHGKIVCAAVSSAAIMAANTVTEIVGDKSDVSSDEGYLRIICAEPNKCQNVLLGFKLHINELAEEYKDKIKVIMEAEP